MIVKPLGSLTKTLSFLLGVNLVLTVMAVGVGAYNYYCYSALPQQVDPNESLLPSDLMMAVTGLGQMLLAILLGITFLLWIYRINKNLHALSGQPMVYTPGWSVGWFFVPIANLFKPYQVVKEIWDISHDYDPASPALINMWWLLWIVSTFTGRLALKLVLRADTADDYLTSTLVYIVSDGIDVLLNAVALLLVMFTGKAYFESFDEQEPIFSEDPAEF